MNKHLHLLRKTVLRCGLFLVLLSCNNLVAQKIEPRSQDKTLLQQQISQSDAFKEFSISCRQILEIFRNSVKDSTFLLNDQQKSLFEDNLQKIDPSDRKGVINFFSTKFNNVDKVINAIDSLGSLANQFTYEYPMLNKLSQLEIKELMEYSFRDVTKGQIYLEKQALLPTIKLENAKTAAETQADCLTNCGGDYNTTVRICAADAAFALAQCAAETGGAILGCRQFFGPFKRFCIAAAVIYGAGCSAAVITNQLQCSISALNQRQSCISACQTPLISYYLDADKDSFGNPAQSVQATTQPFGYVVNSSDCDDTNPGINPNATDVCGNGIDENCDGADLACPCTSLDVNVTTTDAQAFSVNVNGGAAPYLYSLDNITFQSNNVFSGLQTGRTYVVYVKDKNDCKGQQTFILRDPLQCNIQSGSGGQGTTFIEQILGTSSGSVTVDYNMFTIPDQMDVYYNNVLVASTGRLVSGTGSLRFNYVPIAGGPYSCVIRIYAPNNGTAWEFIAYCPVNSSTTGLKVQQKLSNINLEAVNVKSPNTLANSLEATLSSNPSSNSVTLQVRGLKGKASIMMTDLTGRVLWRESNLQDGNLAIPTSHLKAGAYIISLTDGSQKINLKMIRN